MTTARQDPAHLQRTNSTSRLSADAPSILQGKKLSIGDAPKPESSPQLPGQQRSASDLVCISQHHARRRPTSPTAFPQSSPRSRIPHSSLILRHTPLATPPPPTRDASPTPHHPARRLTRPQNLRSLELLLHRSPARRQQTRGQHIMARFPHYEAGPSIPCC